MRIRVGRDRGGGSSARVRLLQPVDRGRPRRRDGLFDGPPRQHAGRSAPIAAVRPVDPVRGQALQRAAALFDRIRRRGTGLDLALRVERGLPPGAAARTHARRGRTARDVACAFRVEDLRGYRAAAGTRLRTSRRTGLDRQEHMPHQPGHGLLVLSGRAAAFARPGAGPAAARPLRLMYALHRGLPDPSHRAHRPGRRTSLGARFPAVHFVLHHRAARRGARAGAPSHRAPRLRLRHLPGCLPVEPARACHGRAGLRRHALRAAAG